jgi:type IV secretion system protein TrbL
VNDLNVIDRFLDVFIRYIDSGFGLLGGDVAFLTTVLIGIDITLAGLFWSLEPNDNVLGKLLKKILYVGAFALILGSFQTLSEVIFRSFAGLGLTAGGGRLDAATLLQPGRLAGTGFTAAQPLLDQISDMMGPVAFFENFLTIAVSLIAWVVVILAFFVLAVQLFITIIEFKLTALAGFVLVPFALWNRTSFLAERVLGHVVSSGLKIMVLGVIVGIGSGFFEEFTAALQGQEPDLASTMSMVLASVALFGLGIFGPAVASGLAAGAPQLGAGAAVGTVGALAGGAAIAGGGLVGGARLAAGGGLSAMRAGTTIGSGASTAYRLGRETSGKTGMAGARAGVAGVGSAAADYVKERSGMSAAAAAGSNAAWQAGSSRSGAANAPGGSETAPAAVEPPAWARRLRSEQSRRHRRHMVIQAVREGDKPSAPTNPDINERDT